MKKIVLFFLATISIIYSWSQAGTPVVASTKTYVDSMKLYVDDYVKDHEVVIGQNKSALQFFPPDAAYRVTAKFEKAKTDNWFLMETSGTEKKMYRVYGTLTFMIHDTTAKLNLYQSQNLMAEADYKDYLLLLFTDKTSGGECYESGRYLDFVISDIKNNELVLDFNKAYNPYCAYEKGKYNCPIPPRENNLDLAIYAGEKKYAKKIE